MTTTQVWLRPTRASPACRYSYPEDMRLTIGRAIFSDCGIWKTNYEKDIVVTEPGKDVCPFCAEGKRVSPAKDPPPMKPAKPKRREQLMFLSRNA